MATQKQPNETTDLDYCGDMDEVCVQSPATATQKRPHETTDPDYCAGDLEEVHIKRQKLLETDAKQAVTKKIQHIVRSEFDHEVGDKEKELFNVDQRLNQARIMMDRLRACVVANYYGQVKTPFSSGQSQLSTLNAPPPSIHPTVRKHLGKYPAGSTPGDRSEDNSGASSPFTTEDAVVKTEPLDFSLALTHMKPHLTSVVGSLPTSPAQHVKTAATPVNHPADKFDDRRQSRFKMKKKVIVGNVSKYIPVEDREASDMSSHKWMVYVRGPKSCPNISPFVKRVWFFLHHSYKPNDLVEVSSPPFHLTRRGWGEFPVRVQLHFVDPRNKTVDIIHHLKLDKTFTGLQTMGAETVIEVELEKLTFDTAGSSKVNPSGDTHISVGNSAASSRCVSPASLGPITSSSESSSSSMLIKQEVENECGSSSNSHSDLLNNQNSESGDFLKRVSSVNGCSELSNAVVKAMKGESSEENTQHIVVKQEPCTTTHQQHFTHQATTHHEEYNLTVPHASIKKEVEEPEIDVCDTDPHINNPPMVISARSSHTVISEPMTINMKHFATSKPNSMSNRMSINTGATLTLTNSQLNTSDVIHSIKNIKPQISSDTMQSVSNPRQVMTVLDVTNMKNITKQTTSSSSAHHLTTTTQQTLDPSLPQAVPVKVLKNVSLSLMQSSSTSLNVTRPLLKQSTSYTKTTRPLLTVVSQPIVVTVSPVSMANSYSVMSSNHLKRTIVAPNSTRPLMATSYSILTSKPSKMTIVSPSNIVTVSPATVTASHPNLASKSGSSPFIVLSGNTQPRRPPSLFTTTTTTASSASILTTSLLQQQQKSLQHPQQHSMIQQPQTIEPQQSLRAMPPKPKARQVSLLTGMIVNKGIKPSPAPPAPNMTHSLLGTSGSVRMPNPSQSSGPTKIISSLQHGSTQMFLVAPNTQLASNSSPRAGQSLLSNNVMYVKSAANTSASKPPTISFQDGDSSTKAPMISILNQNPKGIHGSSSYGHIPSTSSSFEVYSRKSHSDTSVYSSHNNSESNGDIKMSAVGMTKYGKNYRSHLNNINTGLNTDEERRQGQYAILNAWKNNPELFSRDKKKWVRGGDVYIEAEDNAVPNLCLSDFPDLVSLVRAAVKLHPLLKKGVDKTIHPYCVNSLEQWESWPVGKQRAQEWHRACFILRYLRRCLSGETSYLGEELMTKRQLVLWCRHHGFNPFDMTIIPQTDYEYEDSASETEEDPTNPSNDPASIEAGSVLSLGSDPSPVYIAPAPTSLTQLSTLENQLLSEALSRLEDDGEGMVEVDSDGEGGALVIQEESEELIGQYDVLPASQGGEFVKEVLRKRGVKLKETELTAGVASFTSADILFQVASEFMADLLREAAGSRVQRKGTEVSARDVHAAMSSLPTAAFVTTSCLGKESEDGGLR